MLHKVKSSGHAAQDALVLRGLVPRTHVLLADIKAWMAGSSPAKTKTDAGFSPLLLP